LRREIITTVILSIKDLLQKSETIREQTKRIVVMVSVLTITTKIMCAGSGFEGFLVGFKNKIFVVTWVKNGNLNKLILSVIPDANMKLHHFFILVQMRT